MNSGEFTEFMMQIFFSYLKEVEAKEDYHRRLSKPPGKDSQISARPALFIDSLLPETQTKAESAHLGGVYRLPTHPELGRTKTH